jgi:spore germination protein KC
MVSRVMRPCRVLMIFLILAISCPLLAGCYDLREVDDLGYVIAMGLDKGTTNNLRMTLQFAKPQAGGGGAENGGGSGGDKKFLQIVIETPTIYSGLNMTNTFISKEIDLSHMKVMVFSRELAREGLSPYIHAMLRGREFRPNIPIVISRDTAEEYLGAIDPHLVLNASKYYELVFQSYRYTSFIPEMEFHDFYNGVESFERNAVAILGGVNKYESSVDFDSGQSTHTKHGYLQPFEGDFLAGDIPRVGGTKSENIGLAVFDGDRMVGELDGTYSTFYLMCTGEYVHAYWTMPDPTAEGYFVLLDIKQSRAPRHDVSIVEGKPRIGLSINLEGDFLSIQSTIDYEYGESLKLFEKTVEEFMERSLTDFLDVTARELRSDICGFGLAARTKFLTLDDWISYGWKSRYEEATFTVDVNFKARRPGLILKSGPAVSSGGKAD